jgi:tRNA modification GTPase
MPDTIYALSSGRPPAAIAVIRVSGPEAHAAARELTGDLPAHRSVALRELTDPASGERLDEVLVLRFDEPASATGEDVIEFHCHGGRAVVAAVTASLGRIAGLREALPGEFTRRAFDNGRIDLTEAEGLADLLEAETEAQRRAALRLAEGGLKREIVTWQDKLIALSARAELAIDYAGEEGDEPDLGMAREVRDLADELGHWLKRPRAEPLKEGVRVVAAGPPNSGKSSLINVIAGSERIIVSEIEGTTRDVIEVPLALSGLPFVFTDTAGLRTTTDSIEAIGVGLAQVEVERADILLWLGDPLLAPEHPRRVLVHAKADVGGPAPDGSLPASAVSREGVPELLDVIVTMAKQILPGEEAIALNRRQASEIEAAQLALNEAAGSDQPEIQAECLRRARQAFDRLTGQTGIEEVLDALFGRFCLGK